MTTFLGLLLGLAAALIWGGWSVASRMGVTGSLDFMDVTALRFGVSGLILLPVFLRLRITRAGLNQVRWHQAGMMVLGAGLGYGLLILLGLQFATAGHQAIVSPSASLMATVIGSAILFRERLDLFGGLGIALVLAGVAAVGWGNLHGFGEDSLIGYGLFVLAGSIWAFFTLTVRATGIGSLQAAAITSVLSMLLFLPVYFILRGGHIFAMPLDEVLTQAIAQGIFTGVIALICFGQAVRYLGPQRAAMFSALVPATGNILAALILDEPVTASALVGIALTMTGMAIVLQRPRKPERKPEAVRAV